VKELHIKLQSTEEEVKQLGTELSKVNERLIEFGPPNSLVTVLHSHIEQ